MAELFEPPELEKRREEAEREEEEAGSNLPFTASSSLRSQVVYVF
jgi:hypothetical protein